MNKKGCHVESCDRDHYARHMCYVHYRRFMRYGTTDKVRKRGTCTFDVCARPHCALGLCRTHWDRLRRTGSPTPRPHIPRVCDIDGCGKPHNARGYCTRHYSSWLRHGYVKDVTPRRRGGSSRRGGALPESELIRLRQQVGLLTEVAA